MRRSNCFLFALWCWLTRGGYFAVRRSRHIAGWHWLWMPDRRGRRAPWVHYEPIRPRRTWLRASLQKVFYRGRIARRDHDAAP